MTTVWLIRHATPEGGDERFCGRTDIPLSSKGVDEAARLATRLKTEPLAHVYASPLRRALDTARPIAEAHQLPVESVEGLAEVHYGDLENLSYGEIRTRFPEAIRAWLTHPTRIQFPNGEDFQTVRRRVLAAMESVVTRHPAQTVAVVAHAGVIRLLLAELLSIPESHFFRFGQDYAALNRIDYSERGPVVRLINEVASQTNVAIERKK